MKRVSIISGGVVIAGLALLSFTSLEQSAITGKVVPAEGAEKVWAMSATDTIQANVTNGMFTMEAPAGTYKVTIDAKEPYKDVTLENVNVAEGQPSDLGEIKLEQ